MVVAIIAHMQTQTENDHPGPNPLQGHTYIPQGFQKKVTGESAKKSGCPKVTTGYFKFTTQLLHQNNPGPGTKHFYKLWTPMWWSPLMNNSISS